ncbi:MAG: radical SAM protein [Myxococcales bacterium]|nr:radical SAM protein [Myxococcales bacterium]
MRPPLVVVPQHFGSLVFDRRTSRYVPFDREVTDLLVRSVSTPMPVLQPALFEALEPRGYFTLDGCLHAAVLPATPPQGHLLGPLAVHVEVIAACDLSCAHCFAGTLPRKGQLSVNELDALFAELASMGAFRLGLTGGEPLMRRDLLDIVDAATERGLHPCLTTHGLRIDEHWARQLGQRDLVWLNVSLDGARAETHDRIRGAGTFDRAVEKIRLLSKHARFTLAFTITEPLAQEVEDCVALAKELGAHTAVFRPLYPVGTAEQHLALMPSYDTYADALDTLSSSLAPSDDLHAIDPFSPQIRHTLQAKTFVGHGCGAGTLIASVSAAGDCSPCSFLGPGSDAGNLREHSFRSLWNRSEGFTAMRALGCSSCGQGFEGGCRARAQTLGGHLDAPDPWYDAWRARTADRHPSTNVEITR